MNFLKTLLKYLPELLKKFLDSFHVKQSDYVDRSQQLDAGEKESKEYYNPKAFRAAKKEFNKNLWALVQGHSVWEAGKFGLKKYNNISYIKTGDGYYKIYRHYSDKGFKFVKKEKITEQEFNKIKAKFPAYPTWCQVAASIFSRHYLGLSLQYFDGKENDANTVIKNIQSGIYNTDKYEFIKCTKDDAINSAKLKSLVYATFYNHNGRGHIATLNELLHSGQPMIIQAGVSTGEMSLISGFGKHVSKVKYYKLVKK